MSGDPGKGGRTGEDKLSVHDGAECIIGAQKSYTYAALESHYPVQIQKEEDQGKERGLVYLGLTDRELRRQSLTTKGAADSVLKNYAIKDQVDDALKYITSAIASTTRALVLQQI